MNAAFPWRQASLVTLAAAVLLAGFHLLPRGSTLSPMDFVADRETVLQFCDALTSRPPPSAAVVEPVTMILAPLGPLHPGGSGTVLMRLTTISRKPIGPDDLLPRNRPAIRLAITDPAGARLSSVHALSGRKAGEWSFRLVPKAGVYRVSASFTPAVTGTEISAASAFTVLR